MRAPAASSAPAARLAGGLTAIMVGLLAVAGVARSQGGDAAAADPGPAVEPGPEADDDEASGSGSGADALVAPADPAERSRWLTQELERVRAGATALGAARVGAMVVDLATGAPVWSTESDAPFNLASNAKLLTATAALATLGPGFRWRTTVLADAAAFDPATGVITGDLYLRGSGDPTLTERDLRGLAHDLAVAGVRAVTGALVIDASAFDGAVEPPHFDEQPKERAGFRAPIAALAVAESTFTVVVEPDPAGLAPALVRLEPEAPDYVRLTKLEVATLTTGRPRLRVDTKLVSGHLEVAVTGQVRSDGGVSYVRRRVDDPVRLATEVWKRALADEGIKIGRRPRAGTTPTTARALTSRASATLAEVVRSMNKSSDNFLAETVLKTLGAAGRTDGQPASWADGLAVVTTTLVARCGLPPGSFRVENGSGLFAATAMSPAQLVTVLRCADADFRIGPDLVASLPILGVDGTLGRRLQDTPARGRVRAKTGTLAAVSTLAGFAGVDGRRPLVFAILVNDIPPGARPAARALQDAMLERMIAFAEAAAAQP